MNIFKELEKDIRYTRFHNISSYKRLFLVLTIVSALFSFITISFIMYRIYNYFDAVLLVLSIIFSIIVSASVFVYLYVYPKLSKTDFIRDLENEYPLFLLYLYGLVSSGVPLPKAFEIISLREKEFPKISKELSYAVKISNFLGMDFISSLIYLANVTESRKLKEFLYEIVSTSRSGRDINSVIERLYREAMREYEISLRQFIERMEYFLTIYVFIFVVFPLIILIIALLFSIARGNSSLIMDLKSFIIIFIPFAYLIFLYILYLSQPRV